MPGTMLCYLILSLCLAACQTTLVTPTAPGESVTPRPALVLAPTQTPRSIQGAPVMPVVTSNPVIGAPAEGLADTPTVTAMPNILIVTATPFTAASAPTSQGAVIPAFVNTGAQASEEQVIGVSVEGREIRVRKFGAGSRVILLIGGIHGGYEANTIDLIDLLAAHYEANPTDIQAGVSIHLIRAANPDGLAVGRSLDGRFNANGVDLNRNWGCDWAADAVWRTTPVNAGTSAFSEPESVAIGAYIQATRPAAVLFYHSAAGGVFAGNCESSAAGNNGSSDALSRVVGEAAGYAWGQPFTAYRVSGTAPEWVDSLGIPSADVELFTQDDPEFERNLRAISAVQAWVLGRP